MAIVAQSRTEAALRGFGCAQLPDYYAMITCARPLRRSFAPCISSAPPPFMGAIYPQAKGNLSPLEVELPGGELLRGGLPAMRGYNRARKPKG